MKTSVQDCLNLINVVIEPLFSDLALHLRQSSFIAFYIARNLKLSENQVKDVFISASMHDLGLLLKNTHQDHLIAADVLDGHYLNGLEVQQEIAMLNRISNTLYVQKMIAHLSVISFIFLISLSSIFETRIKTIFPIQRCWLMIFLQCIQNSARKLWMR